jgi:hypothetical protein
MMSDLRPRGIEVELSGQKRELLFTINKIDEIQSEMSLPIFDAMEAVVGAADGDLSKETLDGFKKILSILLTNEEETITEDEVGEMVEIRNIRTVAWLVLNAFGISNPEQDEDEEDDDPKVQTGQ